MHFLQILLTSFVFGTQVMLLAVALHTTYAVSRIFQLAFGAVGTALAYAVWAGGQAGFGWFSNFILFLILAGGLAAAHFYLLEKVTVHHHTLIGTLLSFAFGMGLEALLAIIFGADGKQLTAETFAPWHFGELTLPFSGVLTLAFGGVLATGFVFILEYTQAGRQLRAVAENTALATGQGVQARRVRLIIFGVVTLLAGATGWLRAWDTLLTPNLGFNLITVAFIALVVGGPRARLSGTVAAAYLLTVVPDLTVSLTSGDLSTSWKPVLVFGLAAVLLLLRPNGIFTRTQRAV